MKQITYITTFLLTIIIFSTILYSCDSKREPGKTYMPDMAYNRSYKTYGERKDTIFTMDPANPYHKIFYNAMPVKGTMKRGELAPFTVPNDSNGLINLSSQVKSPLAHLSTSDSLEAARLFNINCAVCHGSKAENNGPVASKIGGVKSIIAASSGYSDGRIFYIMTYGQNNMGSYASQLDRKQRWMVVQYIRSLEPKKEATVTTVAAAKTETVVVKK